MTHAYGAPVTIRDRTFPNATAAAKAFGVSLWTIYHARRNGVLDTVGLIRDGGAKAADIAAPNTPAVIGKTVRKRKPCSLCGTFANVSITYAVPIDQGGRADSEWNHHVLCDACRMARRAIHWNGTQSGSNFDLEI